MQFFCSSELGGRGSTGIRGLLIWYLGALVKVVVEGDLVSGEVVRILEVRVGF